MILFIFCLCILGYGYYMLIRDVNTGSEDNNQDTSATKNKREALGDTLGMFIKDTVGTLLKTKQEQLEMCYLLATIATYYVSLNRNRDDATEILTNMNKCLFTPSEILLLPNRMDVYKVHKDLDRAFILSYFLNKARGKTTGKDMTDLLMGRRDISLSDMSEVPALEEIVKLDTLVTEITKGITTTVTFFSL